MNEIIPKFNDSLIINSTDIIGDYLELGIDSILENEILKEIPIFKSLLSVGKISKNIRERNYLKNLAIFINELNSGNIDAEKLRLHQEELKRNLKKVEKELEDIVNEAKRNIIDDSIDVNGYIETQINIRNSTVQKNLEIIL